MSDDWRTTLERRGLTTTEDAARFFDLTQRYVRSVGARSVGCICGYVNVPAFIYEDHLVKIHAHEGSPALEITFKYPDGACSNPVVMVTEQGVAIRIHGEHSYVVPHIETLASAAGFRLGHGRCCPRAAPRQCNCTYSWQCPAHGVTCVGTHD
jgi:hypothetical protein